MTDENELVADSIAELRSIVEAIDDDLGPMNTESEMERIEGNMNRPKELLDRMKEAADERRELSNLPADDADRGIQCHSLR